MLCGLLTLALSQTPAQPPVEVRWAGPAACIDEGELATQIVGLAGEPLAPVELQATSTEQGWQIRVTYVDTTRVVEAQDCGVLTEAVALIVAVRLDAIQTATNIEPVRSEPVEPDPVPVLVPVREPTPAPEPPPPPPSSPTSDPTPVRPTVLVGAGGGLGTLPRGGAALRADVGLRRAALELEVGVIATLGPPSAPQSGVQSTFRLFAGLAQACWLLESGAVEVPLCGRAEFGVLQARPTGLTRPNDRDALWLAPAIRAGLAPIRGRFAPEGFIEVASPLLQHHFEVADAGVGQVHGLPPVVLRLGIALRWRGAARDERPAS